MRHAPADPDRIAVRPLQEATIISAPTQDELGDPAAVSRGTPRARAVTETGFALIVCVAFAALVALGVSFHELWRDEWQAWLIARDSESLAQLLRNRRAEASPAVWHLLLFGLTRWTTSPVAMQVLHVLLATSVVFLIARFAPFPRWQRALLAFGYFFAYEYAVVTRVYVAGALVLFAVCALWPRRRALPVALALLLATLANTSAYGVILAVALSAALAAEFFMDVRAGAPVRVFRTLAAAGIVCAAVAAAVLQMRPPPEATFRGRMLIIGQRPSLAWRSTEALSTPFRAYVPVPDLAARATWNTSFLVRGRRHELIIAAALTTLMLLLFAASLLRRPAAFVFYLAGSAALVLFYYAVYRGGMRHYGHHYLVLVAALWLGGTTTPIELPRVLERLARPLHRVAAAVFSIILAAQLVTAATLYAAELRTPFSTAGRAARVLAAEAADGVLLAAWSAQTGAPIAGQLGRPLYYVDAGAFGTWTNWTLLSLREDGADYAPELLGSLRRALHNGGYRAAVVAVSLPVPPDFPVASSDEWQVQEIARFSDGIVGDERFAVFRVSLR